MRLIDADALSLKIHHGIYVGQISGKLRAMVLKEDIDAAPTIEAEPIKRGRWIVHKGAIECSVCKAAFLNYWEDQDKILFSPWVSCPLCGAKMENPE